MTRFIIASRSYDGAFGMAPGTESHGGCSYCAVASLAMLGQLEDLAEKEKLVQWCVSRQVSGFQGRIEKDPDSCYSFWIGGTLQLLGFDFECQSCTCFLQTCESKMGGFQKFPEAPVPDLLHSYFSVCGLCLCGLLQPLDAMLGMSRSSREASLSRGALRAAPARGPRPGPTPGPMGSPEVPAASEAAAGESWKMQWLVMLGMLALLVSLILAGFQ